MMHRFFKRFGLGFFTDARYKEDIIVRADGSQHNKKEDRQHIDKAFVMEELLENPRNNADRGAIVK
jgi:hypothetical protein